MGADWWPLQMARELDDAILSLRINQLEIGLWILRTEGERQNVLDADAALSSNRDHWFVRETIGMLREVRRKQPTGALVSLSGADPLNVVGILTPGPKLAALTSNRVLYRDGIPVALFAAGQAQFLETLDARTEWEARKLLLRAGAGQPGGQLRAAPIAQGAHAGASDNPLQ